MPRSLLGRGRLVVFDDGGDFFAFGKRHATLVGSVAPSVRSETIAVRVPLPYMIVIASSPARPVRGFQRICKTAADQKSIAAVPCLSSVPAWRFEEVSAAQLKMPSMDSVTGKFLDDIRVHGLGVIDVDFAIGNGATALSRQTAPV